MGEYFLKNCVSFTPGINPSRIQTTDLEFYDQNDFVNDYNFIKVLYEYSFLFLYFAKDNKTEARICTMYM